MTPSTLPVAVIGAGPVGLAAACHLLARGLQPVILEAGSDVGAHIRQWQHVRMFSPWQYNVDQQAAKLLAAQGWQMPAADTYPSGGELIRHYLAPLAALPAIRQHLRLGARVTALARVGHDLMKDGARQQAPYLLHYQQHGDEHEVVVQAVIDASGTYATPNPLGGAGIRVPGERDAGDRLYYGIPDVLRRDRDRYAGKRVLVVGSGHSAFNVLNDLASLARQAANTRLFWAIRRASLARVLGGGEHDQLQERGKLGMTIAQLVANGQLTLLPGVLADGVRRSSHGLSVTSHGRSLPEVDEIVVATGFRPDLSLLGEIRLALDPATQSPQQLAPLIDPNLHSCGTVRPHGAGELQHPDRGFYIVGMKSYGRAPTFLLLTGYEQVRSVVAAIAGDEAAAGRVELVLPETGVCNTQFADEDDSTPHDACGCTLA